MPTMLHELAATAILRRDGTFRPVRAHEISSRLRPCNLVGTDPQSSVILWALTLNPPQSSFCGHCPSILIF